MGLLWTLKSFKQTALFFPSVIGLLIIVRLALLPKVFTKRVRGYRGARPWGLPVFSVFFRFFVGY